MHIKQNQKQTQKKDKAIDLTALSSDKATGRQTYICSNCKDKGTDNSVLIQLPDHVFKANNPMTRGNGWYCNTCQMTYDDSIDKLVRKPRFQEADLPKDEFMFASVAEDRGYNDLNYDEYDRYNPDPDNDERLRNLGATIKYSHIELTDSSGRNRTLVRRQDTSSRREVHA